MIDSSLYIPDEVLKGLGCVSCVWKGTGMCPEGFTSPEESTESGYCDKLRDFLLGLWEEGDGLSAVRGKFHLYVQELVSLGDRAEYVRLENELRSLQEYIKDREVQHQHRIDSSYPIPEGISPLLYSDKERELDRKNVKELRIGITASKLWWARLSESVVKGLGKVADRERRSKDVSRAGNQITVQQLNVLLQESKKYVEDNRGV